MRDTQREAETQAEEEASSPWGPNVGLDPRTPGSHPEPKADAKLLTPQASLPLILLISANFFPPSVLPIQRTDFWLC